MIRIVGLGCRAAATQSAISEAIEMALIAASGPLDGIATIRDRAGLEPVLAAAKQFGIPVIAVDSDTLRGQITPTQSPKIIARFGTGSIAEAAALIAAGQGARLLCSRHISSDGMATAAIAQGDRA